MAQWHVWKRDRGQSGGEFTKIGDFVSAATYEAAAVAAEGPAGCDDGAMYFVSDTSDPGSAMLFKGKPASITLEAT